MPAFIKTKRDEHLWEKAQAEVRKSHPWLKGREFWRYVNGTYHKMKGKK